MVDKILIIPSRVIFDVRMNADGSVNKYKARLVAQGNHQDTSTFLILLKIRPLLVQLTSYYVLWLLKIWKFQL